MAQKNWAVDLSAGIRFSEGIDRTAPPSLLGTLVKKSRKKGRSAVVPLRPVMEG
jgi:hypothetical protein